MQSVQILKRISPATIQRAGLVLSFLTRWVLSGTADAITRHSIFHLIDLPKSASMGNSATLTLKNHPMSKTSVY